MNDVTSLLRHGAKHRSVIAAGPSQLCLQQAQEAATPMYGGEIICNTGNDTACESLPELIFSSDSETEFVADDSDSSDDFSSDADAEEDQGIVLVRIEGRLDAASAPLLEKKLLEIKQKKGVP